jgi:transposase
LKARVLDKAYKNEHDGYVKERLLLVIRVSSDKQRIDSVAMETHRSRAWAYKWYKRYNDEGIEGLRDSHRSGKPSVVSTDTKEKIRQELSDSNTGWTLGR